MEHNIAINYYLALESVLKRPIEKPKKLVESSPVADGLMENCRLSPSLSMLNPRTPPQMTTHNHNRFVGFKRIFYVIYCYILYFFIY